MSFGALDPGALEEVPTASGRLDVSDFGFVIRIGVLKDHGVAGSVETVLQGWRWIGHGGDLG
jgi:hypothetical protein